MAKRPHAPTAQQTFAPLVSSTMRGFVPTPDAVVDLMVEKLFEGRSPPEDSTILDPGCGLGAFEEGILRWCRRRGVQVPRIVGVEMERERQAAAKKKFKSSSSISIVHRDFLARSSERFDYVIGNPPYVPITSLTENERATFRAEYATAVGRFDLYLLFFEQALRLLKPGGRLVFITPEKFLYVKTAEPLRRILAGLRVREILLVDEETFGSLVTYPTITTVDNVPPDAAATVVLRDGTSKAMRIPPDGSSLQPLLHGHVSTGASALTLEDICVRVSCGVATGADGIFVHETAALPPSLEPFAYPTIAGRQLVPGQEHVRTRRSILVPYDGDGNLRPLDELGALGDYLQTQRRRLSARTCASKKPWYAFHDSVPLPEILRPKLLCKDITARPAFWFDRKGTLVPQHSVYYLVPRDPARLDDLAAWLNGPEATAWLKAHCQRAANGFLRLQSAILKKLPVPAELAAHEHERTGGEHSRKTIRLMHAALVLSR